MKIKDYLDENLINQKTNEANAWNAALEKAARVCDDECKGSTDNAYLTACKSCAKKIRLLIK